MKIIIVTILMSFSLAYAQQDERIHMCTAQKEARHLGASVKYRMHIVVGKELKLTRLKDKKWVKGFPNGSGYYIFKMNNSQSGNLFAKRASGYIGDVDDDGDMTLAFQTGEGEYQNNLLNCKLVRQVSDLEDSEKRLIAIAEEADLANGSWETSKVNLDNVDLETEKDRLTRRTRTWEGCKWDDAVEGKTAVLRLVKTAASDANTAKRLQALDKNPGIHAMIGIEADGSISCSERWVWIYTKDGYKLELYFSQGD